MEGEEVEGPLVSREGVGRELSYARNHDDRRKLGMICGVNVFGVLFAARFISLLSLRELRYLECDCFVTRTLDLSALFVTTPYSLVYHNRNFFPVSVYRSST